jgi:hypothetical protein
MRIKVGDNDRHTEAVALSDRSQSRLRDRVGTNDPGWLKALDNVFKLAHKDPVQQGLKGEIDPWTVGSYVKEFPNCRETPD